MLKVLGKAAKYIFGLFGVAVIGLLASLTYQALMRIFPNQFANQIWGMVLFDVAAICWILAFIFQSETVAQYAIAGIGFAVGFLGTLAMVAAEVTLGQDLTPKDTAQIGQWLVYGFILATIIQASLLYAHHFTASRVIEKIEIGIARGQIVDEALRQATGQLDNAKTKLAHSIRQEIVERVMRDLNIPVPADGTVFDPKVYEATTPKPMITETKTKDEPQQPAATTFPEPSTGGNL